jgi:hypothetical protein
LRVSPYLHGRLNGKDAAQDQRSKHRPVHTFAEPSRTKNRSQAMVPYVGYAPAVTSKDGYLQLLKVPKIEEESENHVLVMSPASRIGSHSRPQWNSNTNLTTPR